VRARPRPTPGRRLLAAPPASLGTGATSFNRIRVAKAAEFSPTSSTGNSLRVAEILIVGLGLLVVAGSFVPADVFPARVAPVVESHRFDIAFAGLALAAGLAVGAVLVSVGA
jgi:hypothetical protein